jgi:hypothetical protein
VVSTTSMSKAEVRVGSPSGPRRPRPRRRRSPRPCRPRARSGHDSPPRASPRRADVDVADVEEAGRDLLDTRGEDRDYARSDLKPARSSSVNSWGYSQAAKCPPRSSLL